MPVRLPVGRGAASSNIMEGLIVPDEPLDRLIGRVETYWVAGVDEFVEGSRAMAIGMGSGDRALTIGDQNLKLTLTL
jgi:hypothetical protein